MSGKFIITAASLLCISLAGCATIENPEDCDIRCGFGKNAEFKAENAAMEKELEAREAENSKITQRLNSAKIREASLVEREANLRALLSKQVASLDALKNEIDLAVINSDATQADALVAKAKLANLDANIKRLQALPEMKPADMDRAVVMVSQVVALRKDPDIIKIVSISDNMR